jgi:GST-like protein
MDGPYIVYGSPGSGSVPVEAALTLIGASYEVIGEAVLRDVSHNPAVFEVNPLGQVPALVLPGGE